MVEKKTGGKLRLGTTQGKGQNLYNIQVISPVLCMFNQVKEENSAVERRWDK